MTTGDDTHGGGSRRYVAARSVLGRIVDDRGEPYTPVPLGELTRHVESPEDRQAARALARTLKRVAKEETHRWSIDRFLIGSGLSVVFVGILLGTVTLLGGAFGALPLLVILLLIAVAVSLADRRVAVRRMQRGIGATIVAHGYCARCGYSLEGLEAVGEEPVYSCPECAAVWRADRVTRPHWGPAMLPLAPRPRLSMRLRQIRPPVIVDARGMLCRRVDSWLVSLGSARRAELGRERWRRVRAAIRGPSRWLRLVISAVLVAGLVWLGFHMPWGEDFEPEQVVWLWVLWACGVVLLLSTLASTLRSDLGISARRVVRVCGDDGLCASCGGDLPDSGEGACRVCSRCGASWEGASA